MARNSKTVYECTACGAQSPKWMGRCPSCQAWSTLEEVRARKERPGARGLAGPAVPVALDEVEADPSQRYSTGLGELDRVLGGGVVAGAVTLIGGDPGIGKSTLLLQALVGLVDGGVTALYVTGEESAAQVALRAKRIGVKKGVMLMATTDLGDVQSALASAPVQVVVIDSIQTLRSGELESAAGSVGQLREVTMQLTEHAKRSGTSMFMIGHVTKDGALAGPKVLEHLVDTVLAFEGDSTHSHRVVRTVKNRFGPAHELGVFEMATDGLREVTEPSAMFLQERPDGAAGSLVVPTAQGSRPLLVEVQALVAPALYGSPRRVATGLDSNRLALLMAVLQRKAGVPVLDQDVFASVAGGTRVDEPAVDLALCGAIASSLRDRPVVAGTVAFGEVGLAGEVRAVARAAQRVAESRKLGFTRVVLPRSNAERLTASEAQGVELVPVASLADALEALF